MINTETQKAKLLEEKTLLEGELTGMGSVKNESGLWQARPEAEDFPESDENDLADRGEDFEEKSSTTDTLSGRLMDVNKALDKIEGNQYGKCEMCGMPIEEERLEANPAAPTCMTCMNK